MLEVIHAVPERITALKRKLAARDGKKEHKENCAAIRAEIARLEGATLKPGALASDAANPGEE